MKKVKVRFGDKRISDRHWSKIQRVVRVSKLGQCWEWKTGKNPKLYVSLRAKGTKTRLGHRYFYETLVGEIPAKLDLDHLCRNRRCVNPRHTEPVTRQVNLLRGDTVPAMRSKVTHCPKGHKYTAKNTRFYKNMRNCRECNKIACRARYQSKAERNYLSQIFT